LPDKIHFTAGHKKIYTYDNGGQKLRVINYSSNRILDIPMGTITPLSSIPSDYTMLTTDYVGNMIYENGALKEILLPEGYYQNGTFYYYLKDHLGDNRVTINSSGAVIEKSHYYPSGTRFFTESTNNSLKPLPYRYNGKEMEAMNGLNQMDYGARRRFSWGPIWTSVDPLAEMDYSISPYAYCNGNPVNRFDPNGMMGESSTFVTDGPSESNLPINPSSTFVTPGFTIIEHRNDGDPTVYRVDNIEEWKKNGKSKKGLDRVGDEDPWVNYDKMKDQQYQYFLKHDVWIDDLAMHMRNSGGEDNEKAFLKAFGPIIMGLVMLNPLIGLTNDVITLNTGKDIYGNKSNKYLAGASLLTLNTGEYLKLTGQGAGIAMKLLDKLSKSFSTYSAGSTIKTEFNKQKQ